MVSPTWSVSATKRKATPTSTTSSRKRQRTSDVVPPTSCKRQQTLTQAQWVPGRSIKFEDGDDLTATEATPRLKQSRSKTLRRDTTLTQMDFFDDSFIQPDELEEDPLDDNARKEETKTIPQADGGYESPRRRRKRKSSPRISLDVRSSNLGHGHEISMDSQDYKPSSRRRKRTESPGVVPLNEPELRRSSRRIKSRMKVFSDPAENLDYFNGALSSAPDAPSPSNKRKGPPLLEIKESTEGQTSEESKLSPKKLFRSGLIPETPRKKKTVILSSQSPESLPPSTKRRKIVDLDEPLSLQRTPLRDRSVNTVTPATRNRRLAKLSPQADMTKHKIVTLKLPKRRLSRKPAQIKDSQINLWSIPMTSSSSDGRRSPTDDKISDPENAVQTDNGNTRPTEIPSTSEADEILSSSPPILGHRSSPSQIEPVHNTQPTQLLPAPQEIPSDPPNSFQESAPGVSVRDFALPHRDSSNTFSTPRQHRPPSPINNNDIQSPERVTDAPVDDVDSDFGSPIANDTQFNFAIEIRTSSPDREQLVPLEQDNNSGSNQAVRAEKNFNQDARAENIETEEGSIQDLPVPRLVPTSSPQQQRTQNTSTSNSGDFALPKLPHVSHSSSHLSTAFVPLKDVQSHSSPQNLRSTRSATQKSLYPASIPHPSQMSTQEATQGVFLQSSMAALDSLGGQDSIEKITVKDSSPDRRTISQIPRYAGTQSQFNVDLGVDDEYANEEDEEYNLDPSSDAPLPDQNIDDEEVTPKPNHFAPRSSSPESTVEGVVEFNLAILEEQSTQAPPKAEISSSPIPSLTSIDPEVNSPKKPDNNEKQKVSKKRVSYPSSSSSSIDVQITPPRALQREYTPIPGFNNETQSNFTQNGHVTAAYIHRQREDGILPNWFTPKPYQVPGYRRR